MVSDKMVVTSEICRYSIKFREYCNMITKSVYSLLCDGGRCMIQYTWIIKYHLTIIQQTTLEHNAMWNTVHHF